MLGTQINKYKPTLFILLVVLFLLASWIYFSKNGLHSYLQVRREISVLNAEIETLKKENQDLRDEIEKIKTDAAYLEELARKEFGYLKKNEVIYDFNK